MTSITDADNIIIQGTTIEKYLSIPLQTWYKSGGYCGSISASYIFKFYDQVVHDNYVATDMQNNTENCFIDLMIHYCDTDGTLGSTTTELQYGMTSYLIDIGIGNSAYSKSYFDFSTFKSQINKNRPLSVTIGPNDPTYGYHWITGHGYYQDANNIDAYIIINDGWGRNNVWIESNRNTLDDMVYLED